MADSDAQTLSIRELQVLQLAANGRTVAEIAEELRFVPATVQSDLDSTIAKLRVADRASAVAHALRAGLIS
ncbi:MAG: Bacterial regulatory protein luxR family [Solirubrobacteraceae bacterium]|jgi:DNA-binding NarL/FixJ family response regulator|nr:Bacterial regulatory protein luxR family [Solirubrobacteraceae bacterium]